jgi:cytochrome c-type biogenesis protein
MEVGFPAAFLAGLLTFFTPCVLPLIPAWLALVTGREYGDLKAREPGLALRARVLASTILFVLGFSLVFVSLGAAASALGDYLYRHAGWLRYLGSAVMAVFGLYLLGLLNPAFFLKERRFRLEKRPAGLFGALLVGMAFAAGWTPCVGPVLGSLLSLAASAKGLHRGTELLAVFSLGLSLPFLAIALMWGRILPRLSGWGSRAVWISRALGLMMLALAALLAADKLSLLTFGYRPGY